MNRNLRFLAGSLVIVGAIGYLMFVGIRETSSYYLNVDEFILKRGEYENVPLRVAGRVQAGTIDWDAKSLRLRFAIGAFPAAKKPDLSVPVAFTGIKPDMFTDGRDVIVEGRYRDGVIEANQVLTSCPSKYEAKTAEAGTPASEGSS